MSISITENAARQIKKQLDKRGSGLGLRLGVKEAGCTGFSYVIEYADEIREQDRVFEEDGIKVLVNEDDMEFLQGIEVDYRKEGMNEAFRFNNPNIKDTCGCGESFSV